MHQREITFSLSTFADCDFHNLFIALSTPMAGDSLKDVVILSAKRTPIGKFMGYFSGIPATQLGAKAIEAAVKDAGVPKEEIDEVIMGNVITAGLGQNPARQAALYAGLPYEIRTTTVNKVCGSGMKAIVFGTQAIKAEDYDMIVAGGMENMTRGPHIIENSRQGFRMGDAKIKDAMIFDGLWDIYNDVHMGITGEVAAKEYNLTREELDEFSYHSHMKAAKATEEGWFRDEIVPVEVKKKRETIVVDKDEGIRPDTTIEKLSKLPPAFDPNGMITAGNASQISDAASALVISSREKAEKLGIEPRARIVAYESAGIEPIKAMLGPIPALRQLFKKTGFTIDDFDLIEENEAFASQALAVIKEFDMPMEKVNVHGGAVALGHPIGCSGARIITTLLHVMEQRNAFRGLATMCIGGGNGIAMVIEREE